jgi:hypothetical protein
VVYGTEPNLTIRNSFEGDGKSDRSCVALGFARRRNRGHLATHKREATRQPSGRSDANGAYATLHEELIANRPTLVVTWGPT